MNAKEAVSRTAAYPADDILAAEREKIHQKIFDAAYSGQDGIETGKLFQPNVAHFMNLGYKVQKRVWGYYIYWAGKPHGFWRKVGEFFDAGY